MRKSFSSIIRRAAVLCLPVLLVLAAGGPGYAQSHQETGRTKAADGKKHPEARQERWEREVEEVFGLERGLAKELMTEYEWGKHRQKLRVLTVDDRIEYHQEVYDIILKRAGHKGIEIAEEPPDLIPRRKIRNKKRREKIERLERKLDRIRERNEQVKDEDEEDGSGEE